MGVELTGTRNRLTATLFVGAAFGSTGYVAAFTVASIAAAEITSSAWVAGLPNACGILGTAAGTTLFANWRRGRRPSLATGYVSSVAGGLAAVAGLGLGNLALLLVGSLVLGLGQASNQLSRYVAADMFPAERRGQAIGWVVWAGTAGSVVGPRLIEPAGRAAEGLGLPLLAGGFATAATFMAVSLLIALAGLRPDPQTLAVDLVIEKGKPTGMFANRQVVGALAALITGQAVMVLVMTATPLHLTVGGHSLHQVGVVISAHTFGMFAFSPLTGRLADRVGMLPMLFTGLGLLGGSSLAAALAPNGSTLLTFALFFLGLGWNFGFVAASALLTSAVDPAVRSAVQGRVDSLVWISSAVASMLSGLTLQAGGYQQVGYIGLAGVVVGGWAFLRSRRAPAYV